MYEHALQTKKLLVKKTVHEMNGRCMQKKDDTILIL